ncbi:MAG TPA: hypothetical protein VI193_09615 [Acidimicrobiia bacterium]
MSNKQRVFFDWTLDTLLYLVVLGFFSEYTDGVTIDSFTLIFLASLVLYVLTYVTFGFKRRVGVWYSSRPERRIAHFFSIWAILFFSKFIFLEVLDLVFGDAVDFANFLWLMAVLVVVVVLGMVMELIYSKLGDGEGDPSGA